MTLPASEQKTMSGGPRNGAPVQRGVIEAERQRIKAVYEQRDAEIDADRYAPWNPDVILARQERVALATEMLHAAGAFPRVGQQCLEVGCGRLGWLGELLAWGLREGDLSAIDLRSERIRQAREALPAADLRVGDATMLPWDDDAFSLVVCSTLFTSILSQEVREAVAKEIERVLQPGGVLLWYDFAVNNPANRQVQKVGRRELRRLFPSFPGTIRSLTLAPPIARRLAPYSGWGCRLAAALPCLRTHLMAVLQKPAEACPAAEAT